MLLSFRFANHRSFRDEQELSLLPAYDKTAPAVPVAGIFGANASGKSNVISALGFMRSAVLDSFARWSPESPPPLDRFRLAPAAAGDVAEYAVDILLNGQKYGYGFSLDDAGVAEEWLYFYPRGRRRVLFERERSKFTFGDSLRGPKSTVEEVTRDNSLFLGASAQHGLEQLLPVYRWFETSIEDYERSGARARTSAMLEEATRRERVVGLVRAADLGVVDVETRMDDLPLLSGSFDHARPGEPVEPSQGRHTPNFMANSTASVIVKHLSSLNLRALSLVRETAFGRVSMPIEEESEGTRTWYDFIGAIVDVLDAGSVLLVDEIDASLHPLLTREFIRLFKDPRSNPNGAQLIFTAHAPSLLARQGGEETLARDEIWFTEKDGDGATRLFSLTDFNPRQGLNWERRYLGGSVGAVPYLDSEDFAHAASGTDE